MTLGLSIYLLLFQVSEVNPRANFRYHIDVERPPDVRSYASQRVSSRHSRFVCFSNLVISYLFQIKFNMFDNRRHVIIFSILLFISEVFVDTIHVCKYD